MYDRNFRRACLLAGAATLLTAHAAHAQQAASPAAAPPAAAATPPEDDGQIRDIVVTAQRRSERSQSVPTTIAVVDSVNLARTNVTGLIEMTKIVPGLVLNPTTGVVTTFLRGVGNSGQVAGNEASVPVYIDGVYYARLSPYLLKLNSVAQVEVLKGPQGTLFGRNSSGGLIHVITREPEATMKIDATAGYGNYETAAGSFYATGKVADGILANISVDGSHQGKGWGTNVTTGDDVRKDWFYSIRSKWLFELGDSTRIKLSGYFLRGVSDKGLIAGQPANGTNQGNPVAFTPFIYQPLPNFYDTRSTFPLKEITHSQGGTVRFEYDFDFAQLVSITDYHNGFFHYYNDPDMVAGNFQNGDQRNVYRQVSEEVQLLSASTTPFRWVAGLYYLHSMDSIYPAYLWGPLFGGNGQAIYGRQHVDSYAAYGQATYEFAPGTSITLGARFTRDEFGARGRTDIVHPSDLGPRPSFSVLTTGNTLRASDSSQRATGRVVLDHKFSRDVMVYASVNTGYKAGLFNIYPFTNPKPLEPELITAYEAGFKTFSLNHRLRLNGAFFYYQQKNLQVQQTINVNGAISAISTNAARARNYGFDLDGEFLIARGFSINWSGTVLNAKFQEFPSAQATVNNDALVNGFVPGCSVRAAVNLNTANGGNVEYCGVNAAGKQLPRAPKFTGTVGANYTFDLGNGAKVDLSSDVSYNSGYFWDAANTQRQDRYTLVGASAVYHFAHSGISVKAWGKNLNGAKYYGYVAPFSGPSGYPSLPAEPRTYGVSVNAKF